MLDEGLASMPFPLNRIMAECTNRASRMKFARQTCRKTEILSRPHAGKADFRNSTKNAVPRGRTAAWESPGQRTSGPPPCQRTPGGAGGRVWVAVVAVASKMNVTLGNGCMGRPLQRSLTSNNVSNSSDQGGRRWFPKTNAGSGSSLHPRNQPNTQSIAS